MSKILKGDGNSGQALSRSSQFACVELCQEGYEALDSFLVIKAGAAAPDPTIAGRILKLTDQAGSELKINYFDLVGDVSTKTKNGLGYASGIYCPKASVPRKVQIDCQTIDCDNCLEYFVDIFIPARGCNESCSYQARYSVPYDCLCPIDCDTIKSRLLAKLKADTKLAMLGLTFAIVGGKLEVEANRFFRLDVSQGFVAVVVQNSYSGNLLEHTYLVHNNFASIVNFDSTKSYTVVELIHKKYLSASNEILGNMGSGGIDHPRTVQLVKSLVLVEDDANALAWLDKLKGLLCGDTLTVKMLSAFADCDCETGEVDVLLNDFCLKTTESDKDVVLANLQVAFSSNTFDIVSSGNIDADYYYTITTDVTFANLYAAYGVNIKQRACTI